MRFLKILGFLIFASALLPAQASPGCEAPPDLDKTLKSRPTASAFNAAGAYFAQHQQLSCAISAFESALRLEPGSWEGHYNLGLALIEKGEVARAAKELRVVVREHPEARTALGSALVRLKQPQAAEAEFRAVVKADPRNVFALQQLTELLINQGRYTAAITFLLGAPKDPVLQTNLAIAYAQNGKGEDSLKLLGQLVQAQPDSALAHFNLATEQAHQKLFRAAVGEYRECLRLDPSNDVARTSLVKALNILAEYNEALPLISDYAKRKPDEFEAPYLLGEVYRGLGQYAEAVPLLQHAVKMRPSNYDAQYNLGFVLAKQSRYEEARVTLGKALELRPGAGEAHYQMGLVLRALNQPERAKEQMTVFEQQRRLTGKKETAAVVGGRGNQHLLAGDAQQAVDAYKESLQQDPNNARTYYNLALAYDRLGERNSELESLEQALKLDPALTLAQNQLGFMNLQDGKHADAEARFRKALSLDPQFAEAQNNLGVLYAQQGKAKEAEALFRQATENTSEYGQAFMNLGLMLASQGRLPEAEKEISSAVRLAPNLTRALASLGMVQVRLGKQDEAIANFRKVVALDPNVAEAHLNLGIALADHYDVHGALAEFSQAVTMAPADAAAHYNKGRSLFDLHEYPNAKIELEEASRLAPNYFDPLYLLALAEKQLNNPARSVELLQRAVVLDPRDADAQYLLGQTLSKIDRASEAIAHWKKAVEINPDHGEALYNLTRALATSAPLEAKGYKERFTELQKKRMVTDQAGTLSNFALASAGAHDVQQAVLQMKEALEVCGECSRRGDLHKNLGLIYCRSGDLENGAQQLRLAQKLIPADRDVTKSLQIIADLRAHASSETKP